MSSIDVSLRRMLRQRVYQACKQRGLTLQRAAFKAIQSVLAAYAPPYCDVCVY